MSLQDVLGQADLAFYPQVALLIFATVFVVIAVRVFATSDQASYQDAARMPLEDLTPAVSPSKEPTHD